MQLNKIFILSGLLLMLFACGHKQKKPTAIAFYHWQTQLSLDTAQQELLDDLSVKRLYVKFFDVDWDASQQALVPQAILRLDSNTIRKGLTEIVPTVFITNRSFQEASMSQQTELAQKVAAKIQQLIQLLPGHIQIPAVQLDCDWTPSTQGAFFVFLENLKTAFGTDTWPLSATIRLHQLADPEGTGVPPVARGMLMFYNMGEVASWEEHNSILNLTAAQPYLKQARNSYPIPLDVALPVFSWGVLFRDGSLYRLMNNLDAIAMQDTMQFEKLSPERFRVRKNGYLQGRYLYKDDLIRIETVAPEQLQTSQNLLSLYLERAEFLAYYHLDATLLKKIPYAELEVRLD
jgi:hypothetical protein